MKAQKYKQTNIPWIWEIPEDWKLAKIKQIVSVKITDWPHETPELLLEWVPFASVESVYDGKINFESIRGFISKEQDAIYTQKCKPQRNDIFIVKSWSTTGKIAVVEEDIDFNIWSPLALVRVAKNLYAYKFIYYFFTSEPFQRQIQTFWSFGTQPNIGMWVIENLHISLPPLSTQATIANFLDQKTTQIKKFIENKKKLIELLKEQKQSIIHRAVTKGIDPDAKMKDSGIPWIGEIPEDWKIWKVSRIFSSIWSWTTPDTWNRDYYENWTIKWVNTGDLNDWYLYDCEKSITQQALEKHSALRIFEENSLIIAMYWATIWKLSILWFPATTNQACCVLWDSEITWVKYIYYWFLANKEHIVRMWYGWGQPNISQDLIKSLKIPLPLLPEQELLVKLIEKETSQIDSAISKIEQEISLIDEYRTSLIYQAVTGKIQIT
jgi:type I restriction enzyme, S subunit